LSKDDPNRDFFKGPIVKVIGDKVWVQPKQHVWHKYQFNHSKARLEFSAMEACPGKHPTVGMKVLLSTYTEWYGPEARPLTMTAKVKAVIMDTTETLEKFKITTTAALYDRLQPALDVNFEIGGTELTPVPCFQGTDEWCV